MANGGSSKPGQWSQDEVEKTVIDYFAMLRAELLGEQYSKVDHSRRLLPLLNGRSAQSIEYKRANISAVLIRMRLPYINGYKPRTHTQTMLAEEVGRFLGKHPVLEDLLSSPAMNPLRPPALPEASAESFFECPPERMPLSAEDNEPWLRRWGHKLDFVEHDAQNRTLGKLGEEFVLELEKRRLIECGQRDLANNVEWVSQTRGDGTGFDILSFDRDRSEQYVEVKTTGLGKFFPFYVSATEVRCSEHCPRQYRLYRVFNFASVPRLFVLPGALSKTCQLQPTEFKAVV